MTKREQLERRVLKATMRWQDLYTTPVNMDGSIESYIQLQTFHAERCVREADVWRACAALAKHEKRRKK